MSSSRLGAIAGRGLRRNVVADDGEDRISTLSREYIPLRLPLYSTMFSIARDEHVRVHRITTIAREKCLDNHGEARLRDSPETCMSLSRESNWLTMSMDTCHQHVNRALQILTFPRAYVTIACVQPRM